MDEKNFGIWRAAFAKNVLKRIIKESLVNSGEENPRLVNITNRAEIDRYIGEVYQIFQKSYENINGFLGAKDEEALSRKTSMLTLYLGGNHIYAAGAYSSLRGGNKLFGIGSDGSSIGKNGAREIIKRDIEKFRDWYWCEASGAIEGLFKKYNGYAIPSEYAAEILENNAIRIIDEYHYERNLGFSGGKYVKMIFGFKDEDVFNRVMADLKKWNEENLEFLKDKYEKIAETAENELDKNNSEATAACHIIGAISDALSELQISDLIQEQIDLLKYCISVLRNNRQYKYATQAIELAQYMINTYPVLKMHKFNTWNKQM